jgi:hypothetical protein
MNGAASRNRRLRHPVITGLRTIDMFGLNDPYIAHHPVEIVPLSRLE